MRISRGTGAWPTVSADGRLVAFASFDSVSGAWKATVKSLDGDDEQQLGDIAFLAVDRFELQCLRFSDDGRSLLFLSDSSGAAQIWSIQLDGKTRSQQTRFPAEKVLAFAPRGEQVAFTRTQPASDALLLNLP